MKILLKCCTNGNFGDDLFVISILDRYASENHGFDILVYEKDKYTFLEKKYPNINLIEYPIPSIFYRGLAVLQNKICKSNRIKKKMYEKIYETIFSSEYDAFINIGGSLMAHYETDTFVLGNWIEELFANKIKAKKKYLLNINMGFGITTKFLNDCANIFLKYDDVCFRDEYSYNLFRGMVSCRIAPDVVLNWALELDKSKNCKENKTIGINIINLAENKRMYSQRREYLSAYEKKIVDIASTYIDNGYRILLFGFDDRIADREYIGLVENLIREKNMQNRNTINIECINYCFSKYEIMLNRISECDLFVSTRFHAMVLAMAFGISVFPIAYDEKIKNFMEYIGVNDKVINIKDIGSVDASNIEFVQIGFLANKEEWPERLRDNAFRELDKQFMKGHA